MFGRNAKTERDQCSAGKGFARAWYSIKYQIG